MSEIKRATLISFGADKGEDKKQKSVAKTVRLSFTLPESDESTCPVYNYKEELAVAKKKEKRIKPVNNGRVPNGLDPFGDEDDDDVRRIAQQMEAKYGNNTPIKKKRGKKDDYADIGMGYDESDSFIDNTDGYDEMIPRHVTTLLGGFYINCGALEFKTDESASSEDSSSEEEEQEKPSRKRVLDLSDSEGDTETEKEKDKEKASGEKKQRLNNGVPLVKKKKLLTPDNIRQLKKMGSDEARKKTDVSKDSDSSSPESGSPNDKSDGGKEKENKKPPSVGNKMSNTIDSVAKGPDNNNVSEIEIKDSASESVINMDCSDVVITTKETKSHVMNSEGDNNSDVTNFKTPDEQEQKIENVQLPENLPSEITELIAKLKETAGKWEDGKGFPSGNKLLLSLERKSRCLGKHSKNKIYQHLGVHLNCRKESLFRRAKTLMIEDDSNRLKSLVTELRSQVELVMPSLLENYEKESQRIVQRKSTISEVEDSKQVRMPKRRFSWTEEIKKLFRDTVTIRRRLFTLEGKSKEELETHMNLYLKSDMQPLWPEGWMSMTALTKMYNNLIEKKTPAPMKDPLPKPQTLNPPKTNNVKPATTHQYVKDIPTSKAAVKEVSLTKNIKEIQITKEATLAKGVKEMQKLATNSMLSIIPVTPRAPTPQDKPVMNDLTINILETDNNPTRTALPIEIGKNSGISISPTISTKSNEEATVIRAMPDTIIAPTSEAKQKFAYSQADSWSIKPISKPPTDHKIENIIKSSSKPENLSKPKRDSASPENLSKPKHESKPQENQSKPKPEQQLKLKPVETLMPEMKRRDSDDVIILDETDDDIRVVSPEKKNHMADLKAHPELKRKPGPKSKTKYYDASLIKPVKSASALEPSKIKHAHSTDNLLQENMLTEEHYYKKHKERSSAAAIHNKPNDGDDIQKVMEDLKVLQKMSAPSRSSHSSDSSSVTSSPVSVISYNKNYTKSSSTSNLPQPSQSIKMEPKPDYSMGFQDAFQRQFLNELKNSLTASVNPPTSSKGYNSGHSSSSVSHQDKFFMNANNNYAQQNAGKFKTNYATQQQGTFNLMDDMLANFISEYAYPKTANHKQKPQK